ncbi:hypothetical protein L1987_24103 [Smallanthus sonchifolius]|uniref:Uncharacterized protein n=2 Tax=Smallanthus sonchifolius TaxID=185202 RepID=A0ACB9IK39_9ASTR|nr:hypothetical protein L1987_24088 [Smallanthus sonchifolius]KAI3808157.1 hypothetical protein L1987_24103 [Smallanthus sonchifolius]
MEKYKGVVPQQNGNWGAQIYTNNQRIWLGTFKSEIDAAIAYDRASKKLRSADGPRNFPLNKSTLLEASFQSHCSIETVVGMIKDGSYQAKFEAYQMQKKDKESDNNILSVGKGSFGFSRRVVFGKELTPSDVGKLNRLVIPKRYAVEHFPRVPDELPGFANEVNLWFYDPEKRLWKFRYCYWKSSQSFVFTRGWNQFVKDKKLMPKDKISFYYQQNLEMGFWGIDTCKSTSHIGSSLKLGVGVGVAVEEEDDKMDDQMIQTSQVKSHGLKLFGVQIFG